MTALQRRLDTNFFELPLDVLSPTAALELLTALVGTERISRDVGAKAAVPLLCEWVDYLPLGLELVGRYLAEDPDLPLAEMLKRLKAQRLQDEESDFSKQSIPSSVSIAQGGVKAVFELSWRELDPMTKRVAQLLTLFAPVVIPWKLVETLQAMSLQLDWTRADIDKAQKQLYKRYLIQSVPEREGYYKIHPLIRKFLQAKLVATEEADNLKRAFAWAMVEISQEIPNAPTLKDIESVKDAIPHLEEVAQNLTDALRDEDLLWLCDRLGRFYKSQGLYTLAELWYVQCLSIAQVRLGNDHPDVAATLNNLAGLYEAQGRYSEAEPLYVQALEQRKHLVGDDHPAVAAMMNNLGLLYEAQGRYSEAELLLLQALKLRKRLLGENHSDVANSLNNLGLFYYSQGRYSEAEPLYVQALRLRKQILGNDHPDVATTLNNLALLYYSQGHYTKAELMLVEAVELSERVLGVNHLNPVILRENLAAFRAKRYARKSWLQQVLTKKLLKFVLQKRKESEV